MRRYFVIKGGEELIKNMTPIYTEVSYLCLSPKVVAIQRGGKYFTAQFERKSIDFVPNTFNEVSSSVYSTFCKYDTFKANVLKFNGYKGTINGDTYMEIMQLLDDNEGFFVACIKFKNKKEFNDFIKPDWFGEELVNFHDFEINGITLKNNLF